MTQSVIARLRAAVCSLAFLCAFAQSPDAVAGAAEQALITHYYQSLLRRAPDAGGLAYWDSEATRMRNAGQEPREAFLAMAIQFIESAEYRAFNRDNAGFVTDLYQAFFARAPDAGGLAYWTGLIAQGLPRGVVLSSFLFSTEFNQYTTARLGTVNARPEGTTVIDFYRGYLVRLPDDGGLSYWMWQLRAAQCLGGTALATTADSISALFQGSGEYAGRARSNPDFVADLYASFLRRGGDLAGVSHWVSQLNAGVTRDALRATFLASAEFQARLAAINAADCYAPALDKRIEAARLLQQATWGAPLVEISRVADIGADAWLNEQFAMPLPSLTALAQGYADADLQSNRSVFYKQAFEAPDQLRQRVVHALLQIAVTSILNSRIADSDVGMSSYLDLLGRHAFGNYRDLLRDVTLHPAMGIYLDMLGSSLEVPNENYARELLQLFSIGTVMLNADGSEQRDGQGNEVPTYDEDTVKGFAKAFTGWTFADQDMTRSSRWYFPTERWTVPMKPWTGRRCPQDGRWPAGGTVSCSLNNVDRSFPPPHDTGTKKLLQYAGAPFANLPAGQAPEKDVEDAIDNIFNHPNVGPFVSKQLIQRMVTSNPTPAYVQRIAAVFANNGAGVRGDLRAVVRAILLDNEARSPAAAAGNSYGKLREPIWKFVHLHRAFNARASGGFYDIYDLSDSSTLGQSPLSAPSVFNYYGREFSPGGPLGQAGLVGPEFELANAASVIGFTDFTTWGIYGGFSPGGAETRRVLPNYDRYLAGASPLADRPQALIDELDLLLTAGNLKPTFKASLVALVTGVTRTNVTDQRRERFRAAFWQIVHSAEYAVQR